MIVRTSTDLPDPDSPTMPSVRPAARSNVTPSTALTRPPGVSNAVRRLRTWSSGRDSSGVIARPPVGSEVSTTTDVGVGSSTGAPRAARRARRLDGRRAEGSSRSRSYATHAGPTDHVRRRPPERGGGYGHRRGRDHPQRRENDDQCHRQPPRERPPGADGGVGPDDPTVHEVLSRRLTCAPGHEHDLVHGPEHHADEDRRRWPCPAVRHWPNRPVGRPARGTAAR